MNINYRLKKYNPPFFNTDTKRKAEYSRFKHRLFAWYILHEYNLHLALVHLAKYSDVLKALNTTFKDYRDEVQELYQIDLNSKFKTKLKDILLNGDKLCKICGSRILSKSDTYCSQHCANIGKDNSKISCSLKKYYKTTDCTERHKKISGALKTFYKNLPEDQKNYLKINGKPRSYDNVTAINGFRIEGYSGFSSTVNVFCKKHGFIGQRNYSTLKYNSKFICEKCYVEYIKKKHYKKILEISAFQSLEFIDLVDRYTIELRCKTHGIFRTNLSNFLGHKTGCPKCNSTKAEIELMSLVKRGIQNSRSIISPLELDIYSDEFKFAIEYNGLMWHSSGVSEFTKFNRPSDMKLKHLKKTEMCESRGIQLFHIFENEWTDPVKKEVWKSMINSKIHRTKRIFARKCEIKEISNLESKEFLNKNHMQGFTTAKVRLGLFYNGELVNIMTFSKPRFSKKYDYEIIRSANKLNCTIVGGASKLLKYFERTYKPCSIVSYANRRWSQGNLYEKLGFKLDHVSEPNYFYFLTNENILYSRNKFQKHKLKDVLKEFNPDKTETENMLLNGYRKIFDCGNLVYVKSKN